MAEWRDQLKESHKRLKDWYKAGGIDRHTWILGHHVLAAMHELRTVSIRASIGHFASSYVHYDGQIVAPPMSTFDYEYLGALQMLQGKIGIFSDPDEARLRETVRTSQNDFMKAFNHITALPADEQITIAVTTPLVFLATDLRNEERLGTLQASVKELYPRECPAWMGR